MNHIGTREIATERLTLRRFEIEDAENMFYNWANDPEVTKYLTWPAHESVDTTETILKEWISKYDEKDFYQWAIELNDLEQPIGTISAIKTDETMEYVGILAKLELSPEEAEAAKKDMADMLDYIDKLEELDTSGIEPMSHVFPVNNVFRDDVVTNGDGSEATLANAPVKKDGGFKVPKTIGE